MIQATSKLIRSGSDHVDPSAAQLRSAFGHFATGVTIVTALTASGQRIGMTANSFSSLSLDPPLLLWSIARASTNYSAFCEAEFFTVHVLDVEQSEVAKYFSARDVDRFARIEIDSSPEGVPRLRHCHACFECRKHACFDGGDHTIITGRILRLSENPGSPLLFYRGRFGRVESL